MTDTPLTVQNLNPVIVDCITWIKKTPPFVLDEAVIHDLLEFSANETRRALEAWQQDEHELSENEKDTLEACEVLLSKVRQETPCQASELKWRKDIIEQAVLHEQPREPNKDG